MAWKRGWIAKEHGLHGNLLCRQKEARGLPYNRDRERGRNEEEMKNSRAKHSSRGPRV